MPLTKHCHMTLCNHADCNHAPRAWLPWLLKAWASRSGKILLDTKELSPVHVEAKKSNAPSRNERQTDEEEVLLNR